MSWFSKLMSTGIGKKLLMALTGLFLIIFLVVHLSGNLQLFKADQGYAFNVYSKFMTTNPFIATISYLLYATFLVHIIYSIILTIYNQRARPTGYAKAQPSANSTWMSRNMGILGTIIFVFLAIHLANFWYPMKYGEMPYVQYEFTDGGESIATPISAAEFDKPLPAKEGVYKDLYKVVSVAFQEWWIVAIYVLAMVGLGLHLAHGFASAFQTLGLRDNKYYPVINQIGVWFSVIVPLGFASLPIYFFFFK